MDCPTCGVPALPEGPDAVIDSTDGPLLLTRWRCVRNHWWHMTTDASPARTHGTACDHAGLPAGDLTAAIALGAYLEVWAAARLRSMMRP